ncbi:MAG: NAD(P)/FAD-dependent oxidoreductase [Pseudomonadota bacterium]
MKIGIIGGGFAGIATARVFDECGYDVVVYEKERDIGGVWSSSRRYPGLTTQNNKCTYYLSELEFPNNYPEWPTGRQVQEYFELYIDKFDLGRLIHTGSDVIDANFDVQKNIWRLTIRDSSESTEASLREAEVDYLIVCNGIFSIPFVPDYPGAEAFRAAGGSLLHTSEFTDKTAGTGKHVVVTGYGKSSCDVATAMVGVSKSTTVVARNLLWKIPKKLLGVLNYKYLFLTRMGEGLFPYIRLEGFEKFLHSRVGRPIRNFLMGSVERVISSQLRLRKLGLHPNKPLETIARSTVSLVTEGFYEAVGNGDIRLIKGAQIDELMPGKAILSTGETIPADVVICGTGWDQQASFLDPSVAKKIVDEDGNFRLYRSMIPVDTPNLAFNGYNSSFFSQLNCEIGALWLLSYLNGGHQLPSREDQNAHIDRRLAWMIERTDGKHSKGTNIIPFSMHNIDELLDDMGMNLGRFAKLCQWLGPVKPSSYRHILPELTARLLQRPFKRPIQPPLCGDSSSIGLLSEPISCLHTNWLRLRGFGNLEIQLN